MGLGIRRRLQKIRIQYDLFRAKMLYFFFDVEAVVIFLKGINKESAKAVLRRFGAHVGENCDIESGIILHNVRRDFSKLSVGHSCHIGKEVFLDLRAPIFIRDRSTISMRTVILTHTDFGHAGPFGETVSEHDARVEIGSGAYIGAGVIILSGTKVGAESVVGAGAVVNKDVPSRSVVAGIPAKEVKKIRE